MVGKLYNFSYNIRMYRSWSKGFSKLNHPSLLKLSETMKRRKIDNFSVWRENAKAQGLIRSEYPAFECNGDLAELMGVVYGDGNIEKFPRTERLIIAANFNATNFIKRYQDLTRKMFNKEPTLMKSYNSNCVRISIYQNKISKRLGVPTGNKSQIVVLLPKWIKNNHEMLKRFLRGLFEAEGSFSVHKPTSTYKFSFSNRNDSLLKLVFDGLIVLGFHPNLSGYRVQISRKEEVYRSMEELQFRKY